MNGERRRAAFAQNLFRTDAPARTLVRLADIEPGERVYDLGAGTGRVTRALIDAGALVVAVERDANLARKLAGRFANVRVLHGDLTGVSFEPPFKVVANLPFNATAAALRRLLFEAPGPDSATLVLQREAARKWAGAPKLTAVSLMAQPWFDFGVSRPFRSDDFVPAPRCEVAVLRVRRRASPLLAAAEAAPWRAFVAWAFARPDAEARRLLRPLLSQLQVRRLAGDLGIEPAARRADLDLAQWLGVYRFAAAHAAPRARRRVLNAPR